MIRFVADTHSVIWYVWGDSQMSGTARAAFDDTAAAGEQVAISSISLVEIVYLIEKRRIDDRTLTRILDFLDLDEVLKEVPVNRSILDEMASIPRAEVPDMPDRIIAATAVHGKVPLISRDRKIQSSSVTTIW